MSVLLVPELDRRPWPTLGPQVIAWIEENLTFGPGPLRGQPAVVDEETQGLICRMYEVHPRGSALAGHRRFNRVAFMQRKGTAKTEKAAWIVAAELHPKAPVRVIGWKGSQPIGGGVVDPYIPMVAYTEEQSEELAFGALLAILQDEHCPIADDFDIGLERIMRRGGDGKAVPLASAPNSRDGARTTFQHFDETHHMVSPRLRKAHQAMMANLPKRTDSWSMETTTSFEPGQNSVAEVTYKYACAVNEGKVKNSQLFFFYRFASDHHDLKTVKGLRAAVREASGPAAKWSNLDAIVDQWKDPEADKNYLERVWLNKIVKSSDQAFDPVRWAKLAKPKYVIPAGALVTVGFDGARRKDSTAIVVTEVATFHQVLFALWEKPEGADDAWEVPGVDVDDKIAEAFERWEVWKLYADPAYWESYVDQWSGKYGEERVLQRWTGGGNEVKTAHAVRAFTHAITAGELSHDGDPRFARHIANAQKKPISRKDDEGKPLFSIRKERSDSPKKMDAAMAAVLSGEARGHAVAAGATNSSNGVIYNDANARPEGFLSV